MMKLLDDVWVEPFKLFNLPVSNILVVGVVVAVAVVGLVCLAKSCAAAMDSN